MQFEWDEDKDSGNRAKHGIGFEAASAVFLDPFHVTFVDDRFDYGEQRFLTLGAIEGRVFVVASTARDGGDTIRIISARKANRRERRLYADEET